MTLLEAVKVRHSVRKYKDEPIAQELVEKLQEEIEKINREQNLHFQLILNEPKAFHANKPHYGQFSGVKNYIAVVGPKEEGVEAALLAPTAINQQQFKFIYADGKVRCKMGLGFCIKTDMGIVKYHFELGAGKENFSWE